MFRDSLVPKLRLGTRFGAKLLLCLEGLKRITLSEAKLELGECVPSGAWGEEGWMLNLLKTHFGFDQFLPLQEEIIQWVMSQKDALVLMPTGGGKSLCYQLPALMLPGLTLVISPLIALMKDQVDSLKANGLAAEFINSTLSPR